MRKLFTVGCSFTAEFAPVGQPNTISNYDRYKEWRGGTLPDVWPTLLGNMLNYEVHNLAGGGGSNYRMINNFIENFDKMDEGDVVIIGWTQIERFYLINHEGDHIMNIAPMATIERPLISVKTQEEMLYNRTHLKYAEEIVNYIKFLNYVADKKGIKLFHWTSDDRIFTKYSDFIDDKNFILPPMSTDRVNILQYFNSKDFYNGKELATIDAETCGVVKDGHLGEFGHKVQAEYFYKHITKFL